MPSFSTYMAKVGSNITHLRNWFDQISVDECSVDPSPMLSGRRSARLRSIQPMLAAAETSTSAYCAQKKVCPASMSRKISAAPRGLALGRPNFLN
jgi:hypothetical protein